MNSSSGQFDVEAAEARDQRLAELLEQLVDQSRHGKLPDLESMIAKNPKLADEKPLGEWRRKREARETGDKRNQEGGI